MRKKRKITNKKKETFVDEELMRILEAKGFKRNAENLKSDAEKPVNKLKKKVKYKPIKKPLIQKLSFFAKIKKIFAKKKNKEEKIQQILPPIKRTTQTAPPQIVKIENVPEKDSPAKKETSSFFQNMKNKFSSKKDIENELEPIKIIAPTDNLRLLKESSSESNENNKKNIGRILKEEIIGKKSEQNYTSSGIGILYPEKRKRIIQ